MTEETQDAWYSGPLKYMLALFLISMMLFWMVPKYAVKLDPEPNYIPTIAEVVPSEIDTGSAFYTGISTKLINGKDPVIKEVADKIVVKACKDKGKVCHAKALFYFVRDNFEYVSDPTAFEYVKSAKQSLVSGGGDCDDAAVLLGSLLDAIGVRIKFKFIPNHVYLQAHMPYVLSKYRQEGNLVNLDPTCKNCEFGDMPLTAIV